MKEEKDKLRNQLFEKYFENQEGIVLTELVRIIEPIVEVWQKLHKNLQDNCEFFDMFSHIEMVKVINKDNQNYLIIKTEI